MIAKQSILRCLFVAFTLLCCTTTFAIAAETRIETILADGGKAAIIFAASPLKTMTEIPFSIELIDGTGSTIKNAELALSLTMPFMAMPPNNPKATWRENSYKGRAIFTMAGVWQVNVEINRSDSATEKIIFDIEMVVMK